MLLVLVLAALTAAYFLIVVLRAWALNCTGTRHQGIVSAASALTAPLSRTPCVHWYVSVVGYHTDQNRTLGSWSEDVAFELKTADSTLRVPRCEWLRKVIVSRTFSGASEMPNEYLKFLADAEPETWTRYRIAEETVPIGQLVQLCCEPDAGATVTWRGRVVSERWLRLERLLGLGRGAR